MPAMLDRNVCFGMVVLLMRMICQDQRLSAQIFREDDAGGHWAPHSLHIERPDTPADSAARQQAVQKAEIDEGGLSKLHYWP